MDKQRAREIVSSPKMVNVTFNGSQIYIERVNEENNTADIHLLKHPNNKFEVSIKNLKEH